MEADRAGEGVFEVGVVAVVGAALFAFGGVDVGADSRLGGVSGGGKFEGGEKMLVVVELAGGVVHVEEFVDLDSVGVISSFIAICIGAFSLMAGLFFVYR